MEDLFNSVYSTHKGISFSTVVVFGAFIFLILQVHLSYKGRISDVLRKTSFFSMILLYIQGILGVFLGIYSPEFSEASGFSSYFNPDLCRNDNLCIHVPKKQSNFNTKSANHRTGGGVTF